MSGYTSLLKNITSIVDKYQMGALLNGFTPELINALLQDKMDKIREADSYDKTIAILNDGLKGYGMSIEGVIKEKADREQLYANFKAWRLLLLKQ